MKKIGLGLLGLVVLLAAGILVAPSFIDWNAYKDRIAAEVEQLTGRALTIEGDIGLTLLPVPALSVEEVRLANLEGGSQPTMLALESLEVRVAPLPLLQGRLQVDSLLLVEPLILLEVLPDGRKNWELPAAEATEAAAPTARRSDEDSQKVRLDSIRISNGTLVYRDVAAGTEERLEGLEATIAAESLRGPFAISGSVRLRGLRADLDFSLGRLPVDGATPLNLVVHLPQAGDSAAQFAGALSLHPEQTSLRGRLKANGANLALLLHRLTDAEAPGFLGRPFMADGELIADPARIAAEDLNLRLGEHSFEGKAELRPGSPLGVRVELAASRLDLDKLLADRDGAAETAPPAAGPAAGAGPATAPADGSAVAGPALPADVEGTFQLAVDALIFRDQIVRQLLVSAKLADGRVELEQAIALLPGGSDISVAGTLAPEPQAGGAARFAGRLEAASDNLRAVLDWLGADVTKVPAERLRRMSLTSRLEATSELLTLGDIDLRVDLSRAGGGVVVALRERPAFGVGLAVDKVNLDAYLPAEGVEAGAGAAAQDAAPAAADAAPGAAASGAAASGAAASGAGLAGLQAFDANLDLRLGGLTLRGISLADLHLDGTLQQGTLTLREAVIGDLGGGRLRLSGSFANLGAEPKLDAAVDLEVSDPVKLAELAGLGTGVAERIGPFDLAGTLKGTLEEPSFDLSLAALGGRLGATGSAQPLAAPLGFDVLIEAEHADVAELAQAAGAPLANDTGLGGLDLKARLAGTTAALRVTELDGTLGPAKLSGELALAPGAAPMLESYDLAVALSHPDLAELARALGREGLEAGLGGVELEAQVSGDQSQVRIAGLNGRLGETEVSGTLGADFSGAKPAFTAELVTGVLPVAALAALSADAPGPAGGAAPGPAAPASAGRWSTEPIDVAALNGVDAELDLRSTALLLGDLRLDEAVVEASLVDGLLDLKRLEGRLYEGALSLKGKLEARETLHAGLAVSAREMDLGRLLQALAETDRAAGPVNLEATLASQGRSEAELIGALAGTGTLDGTVTVKAKAEEQFGAILLGILGEKIREIRGVTDATNLVFSAFAGAPSSLRGSFTVERGVIATRDLRLDGRQAAALTEGTIGLPAWQIDTRTSVYREQDAGNPYLTVHLTGPLDEPNPRVTGQILQRQQPAPDAGQPGAPEPGQQPGQPAQPLQPTKPEDLLKEGLKGLLKGLQQ